MRRGSGPSTNPWGWLLSVMLLVSLACTLPALGSTPQPKGVPPETAGATSSPQEPTQGTAPGAAPMPAVTPAVTSAPPAADFPPALVEAVPPPRSHLSPGDSPVLYFNQPMERASVEAALQVEPAVDGRLDWLDDATARFVPRQALAPETGLTLTVGAGARALGGQTLDEPAVVEYLAAAPLRTAERIPAPDATSVDPSAAVIVTFNAPVAALGADPQSAPPAFTLEPDVPGQGEWINTSTYAYYPDPALVGGTRYTVRISQDLHSAGGLALAADEVQEWSFTTAAPALLAVEPALEQPVALDARFTLTFNQAMHPASVEAGFAVRGPGGEPVAGSFTWNAARTAVTFQPDALLDRATAYTLTLSGAAQSVGGASLGSDFAMALESVPPFAVTQTRPAAGESLNTYDGYATVVLDFGSPVASGQDLNRLVTISPEVVNLDVARSFDGYQLYISGYFQPSTSYSLSVLPELQDRWGAALGSPFNYVFSSQPARPSLTIPVRQAGAPALYVPYGETTLPAYATNITRLNLSRGSLTLAEFIQAAASGQEVASWENKVEAAWIRDYYLAANKSQTLDIPLNQNSDLLTPGLYFLQIETQPQTDSGFSNQPHLLVVSPLQMVLKVSSSQAFVWVTRLSDYAPVEGRQVAILDSSARMVASCTTGAEGICQAELPDYSGELPALYAVAGQPGEPEFSLASSVWSTGVTPWEFQLPFQNKGSQPEIYLYTDRPIYRPGQAVHFRAVVRDQENARYSMPADTGLEIDVVSPYDPVTSQNRVLGTVQLQFGPYGTADGLYTLPEDAPPGSYILRPRGAQMKEIYFEVADYRKPEIDLSVQFAAQDLLLGQDAQARVNANYFFGAPAGSIDVRWSLFRAARSPDLLQGMATGRVDLTWTQSWAMWGSQEVFVMEGSGQTGRDGQLLIQVDGEELRERLALDHSTGSQLELTLEVTVEDESGLPVSARGSMRLHPAPSYVGVSTEQWAGTAGSPLTFQVRLVDWSGAPEGRKPLHSRFRKVTFVRQSSADPYAPPGLQPEYSDIGSTDFVTSAQGEARLAYTPADPGTYMIEVTGEDGAVAQQIVWVGGPGSAPWPQLSNQRLALRAEQSVYQPGQPARIFIPNPFPSGALALVTVERGRVMRSFVVQFQESSHVFELPVLEEDAPNVYVSVTLLGRTAGRPDFRQGYLELQVDPAELQLQVELLSSPRQARPGEPAAFQIRVTDAAGSPVRGEFSLALVDRAVLALAEPNTPSIMEAFYGRQPLGVGTGLSLAGYAGRFLNVVEGRGGGGGGGEAALPPAVRSDFEDTAYWNGAVETDENGIAQVTLTLPDNLTTWRADVRGVTVDTQVGQATLDLTTSQPLLIRPVAPRFAVLGDHLELAAVVHNNTDAPLQASVRLETPGFTHDEPHQAVQAVEVPAGGRHRVSWWGTVQDVPSLDLVFSVEAGELSDAASPETGPLPVLRFSSSQTFGTSGILAEAGAETEWIALPRSFAPAGGELSLELAPSLAGVILDSLAAQAGDTFDFTEPVLSRLLASTAAYSALNGAQAALPASPVQADALQSAAAESAARLARMQNEDGGWGWSAGYPSDPYISSYVVFGLAHAPQFAPVDQDVLARGRAYLSQSLFTPRPQTETWQLDRLAFQLYALRRAGQADLDLTPLYNLRARLSPWGRAFLALAFADQSLADQSLADRAQTLVDDLLGTAERTATGAHWLDAGSTSANWSSASFTTAVVTYALAQLDPSSALLSEASRYLLLNRLPQGGWRSTYESAWAVLALLETARATGSLDASFTYAASLNGSPLISGQTGGEAAALNPVSARVPLSALSRDGSNSLQIERGAGTGQLAYRAFLRVDRSAQDAPALQRGLSLARRYYLAGQDCRVQDCQPLSDFDLDGSQPVLVRLTLTVPEDMNFVVVEDFIPAGAEILNPRLKSSQRGLVPQEGQPETSPFSLENPFDEGWGWWLFKDPQIQAERIRWAAEFLPAGTYELTYRLTPLIGGDFQVMPARAYQHYFPEVEASTAGEVIRFQ